MDISYIKHASYLIVIVRFYNSQFWLYLQDNLSEVLQYYRLLFNINIITVICIEIAW